MTPALDEPLADLYESDETAWLEAMARLAAEGRLAELDGEHLAEYLADMATRDRREVESRLAVLIAHLLKWQYQPAKRTRSWRLTVIQQRQQFQGLFGSRTLRNHAEAKLATIYKNAVVQAAAETGLPDEIFPAECPYTLDQILNDPVSGDVPE